MRQFSSSAGMTRNPREFAFAYEIRLSELNREQARAVVDQIGASDRLMLLVSEVGETGPDAVLLGLERADVEGALGRAGVEAPPERIGATEVVVAGDAKA